MAEGILDGVRILDLTTGQSGPLAVRLLAEAGADVVKVEPPGGDPARARVPAGFASWNRSKRSVVLDLVDADDRRRLDELLAGADVVVHELAPAAAAALGLDEGTLASRFPQLIVASLLSFPRSHPDAELPASDLLVQARLGILDEQFGYRDGPIYLRLSPALWGSMYLLASGILARLILRARTGQVGPVATSLAQGALAPCGQFWHRFDHPNEALRFGSLRKEATWGLAPMQCTDGWALVMATRIRPSQAGFLTELGVPDDRDAIRAAVRKRSVEEIIDLCSRNDVPCTKVAEVGEALVNEQARLNGYVVELDDPVWGRSVQAASPWEVVPPSRVSSPAPALGQHDGATWEERSSAVPLGEAPPGRGPLAGLKVLDFGMFLAGPFAPQCLADLGADVIKVEATDGDRMRAMSQFYGCQRNKRDIALDLANPASREVLERLVRWADVVHHNIRRPAQVKLGIDEPSLRAMNPDIIVCHTGTYGTKGPRADWPGYDPIAQAESGWMFENGGAGNPPLWYRFGLMDHQCALSSLVATLLAIYRRETTGDATFVTASLLGAAVLTSSETLVRLDGGGVVDVAHLDAQQTGVSPYDRIAQCTDGWVALVADTEAARATVDQVGPGIGDLTVDDAVAALEAGGASAERVRENYESGFFDSEANQSSKLCVTLPSAEWGDHTMVGAYWDFGDVETVLDTSSPALGEHSIEILGELGFADDDVEKLLAAAAVVQFRP